MSTTAVRQRRALALPGDLLNPTGVGNWGLWNSSVALSGAAVLRRASMTAATIVYLSLPPRERRSRLCASSTRRRQSADLGPYRQRADRRSRPAAHRRGHQVLRRKALADHDRHFAVALARGLDGNLDVLTEGG